MDFKEKIFEVEIRNSNFYFRRISQTVLLKEKNGTFNILGTHSKKKKRLRRYFFLEWLNFRINVSQIFGFPRISLTE